MDGVLVVDKPAGPTSHDVVDRARRALRTRRIGHTGTLDPFATGVLVLCVGRATRLARFLSAADKDYRARVRLGFATTTDDLTGDPIGEARSVEVSDAALRAALAGLVGSFDQVPPAFSARQVGGRRLYELARRGEAVARSATPVTVHRLAVVGREGDSLELELRCSAGFYVRALARDLGETLGCGGHLADLRRTAVGLFRVEDALTLADAERLGPDVAGHLIPPARALDHLPSVAVTEAGLRRALHGNTLSPEHLEQRWVPPAGTAEKGQVRVLGPDGRLVALAYSRGGFLHPAVVLG